MKYEDVSFKSPDGLTLKGWWIPVLKGKAQGTVVLTHGVFQNRVQMLSRAVFLHTAGYQVLMMDLRGHGESDKAALSGGLEESKDFLGAADYLRARQKLQSPLVFFGLSLGGMAALRAGVIENDAVLIVDSPLPDARSYVSQRTVGKWFVRVPGFFDRCIQSYNRATGLHLTVVDLSLTPTVEQLKDRWVLYFVGEKDAMAPVKDIELLFKKTATHTKQLSITPGAEHDGTMQSAPALYERTVLAFLDSYKKSLVLKAVKQKVTR
jgi:alpha-beta hydrolase superfamily lysophospholipase